jgi:hypothetical protein
MIKSTPHIVPKELMSAVLDSIPHIEGRLALNTPSGEFFYDPWIIKDEYQNTVWDSLLQTLPYNIGEARLITLQPGTSYLSHADIDDRYHLSLTGNKSYLVDLTKNEMHTTTNDSIWYDMDAGLIHSAVNFGDIPRIQLVVRKLLIKTTKPTVTVSIAHGSEFNYRYLFDDIISPWLNRANKNEVIKNFKHDAKTVTFELDLAKIDDFKVVAKNFNVSINDS